MNPNNGKILEQVIVDTINGKKAKEIPIGFKENIDHMIKFVKDDDIIEAELVEGSQKPDICISVKGEKRYISLKSGLATQVGTIGLKDFIRYLREKGISKKTLKTIVNLHFCDGTLDDTGKVKYTLNEYKGKFKNDIEMANEELNADKELIKDLMYKVIFKGFYDENIPADYLYFGTEQYGSCCNYRQMCKYIDSKKWSYLMNLHIGPLQFRPIARYAHRRTNNDKGEKRWGLRFFWQGLSYEVERISKQYRYQHDGYVTLAERAAIENG